MPVLLTPFLLYKNNKMKNLRFSLDFKNMDLERDLRDYTKHLFIGYYSQAP